MLPTKRVDLGRLKEPAFVILSVALGLVVVDFLAGQLLPKAASLEALGRVVPSERELLGSRVAGIEDQLSGAPLGVVMGLSTAREGISSKILEEAELEAKMRWVNLGASGGSYTELLEYARPLLASSLEPEVIVLGIHAAWLAREAVPTFEPSVGPGAAPRTPTSLSFVMANRNSLRLGLDLLSHRLRFSWRTGLGSPISALYPPREQPFTDRILYSGSAPSSHIETQRVEWAKRGWFDAARYEEGPETRALLRLVRSLGSKTPRLVIVGLPEKSEFRERVPPSARGLLASVVALARMELGAEGRRGEWVDLTTSIGDEFFYDLAHVSASGRDALTLRLIESLRREKASPR
ncbi:MAG: hypothetical protein HY791_27005 [Deltaproteobacteria bacterium]|nr:hypothetical protein [Deltaproteobacteria bacterium]